MTGRSVSTIRRSRIDWRVPAAAVSLSDKDRNAPLLADAEIFD